MSSGLILLGYALIAGTVGTAWLRHARWPEGSPRLGILAWQSLASSVLLAVCGFALSLAMSLAHAVDDLTAVFGLCAQTVGHTYNSLTETAAAFVGLAAFSLLVARSLWLRVRGSLQRRREQADRVSILDMVGDHARVPGAVVITHTEPYAFCISGKRRRVVFTSAAVASLNDQEVEAVLAHEWAHLGQGHHRTLASCNALFAVVAPPFFSVQDGLGSRAVVCRALCG